MCSKLPDKLYIFLCGHSGKNQDKFMQYVEKRMRKLQNEQQTNLHKCHLMCLVARLKWLNRICNEEIIKVWISWFFCIKIIFTISRC